MPALANIRHELFCQNLAKGMSDTDHMNVLVMSAMMATPVICHRSRIFQHAYKS